MLRHKSLFALAPLLLVACATETAEDAEIAEGADELSLSRTRQAGSIGFGEAKDVTGTAGGTVDRALRIDAKAGDVLDAWVRGTAGADAKAWLVDASSKTLATNDDASATTRDAHVRATVTSDGAYYLVFRDKVSAGGVLRASLSTKLAALPDGTYHIPTGKRVERGVCRPGTAVFRVEKRGDSFTVRPTQSEVTSSTLVGSGSIASGTFKGNSSWGSEVYGDPSAPSRYPPNTSYYDLNGTLTFENGALRLNATIKGGLNFVTTTTFGGQIGTTIFGQSSLPPGAQRATLSPFALTGDRPTQLETIVIVRTADGRKQIALPQYVGDAPSDDARARAQNDCSPAGPQITQRGATLGVSWRGKYVQASLPEWFVRP